MDRREALKAGLCLLGGACLAADRGWASDPSGGSGLPRAPANLDLRSRTFELRLEPSWKRTVDSRLVWLESMLRRLGREVSLALWNEAFRTPDDGRMAAILETGWEAYDDESGGTVRLDEAIDAHFSEPVEGIAGADAHALVLMDAGIRLPVERHPSLKVRRQITTYDSLHLRLDGVARLAGAMTSHLGKEGELIAYDLCRDRSIASAAAQGRNRPAAEVLREWADLPRTTEATIFSAGLDVELVKESDIEVILHVTACEWARYFRERHPSVGYLVACSTDEAGLRAATDALFMQRSSTIMEGGAFCGFRIYKA
jgi:L-2-amino-thiazoline-4-carboxylic acid hydrolase